MLHYLIHQCVLHRVGAVVLVLVFGGYGLYAYFNTAIEAYPDVTPVQVYVIGQVPGLAPDEVERQLTVPLERALNGTPGLETIRSESLFGLSLVWLIFEDGTDNYLARQIVNERLGGADLPDDAAIELSPDYTPAGKVYYYEVTSDRHDLFELRAAQEWQISRVLRQVPGVADISGLGGFLEEVHVEVDPARLAAHGLTLSDVTDALAQSNINVSGGFQRHGEQEMVIRGIGYIVDAAEIADVVLVSESGTPVTVADVASVIRSHAPRRGTVGRDLDNEVVQGIVLLRRGENPSIVLEGVRERIDELNSGLLPEGMQVEMIYDRQILIDHTLHTVHNNLLHGALLVIAIVWLFLRSLMGSMIVAIVIPLSLLTAFTGLYLLGLPANLISMGAIDFGIIVDGAVVLVENVIAQARKARPKNRAEMTKLVVAAAVDVSRPTFYAMAIIIAALMPVLTLESVEGRIFQPLAMTYGFAMIGALILALTLVPALCAVLLRVDRIRMDEPVFVNRLRSGYAWLLNHMLNLRPVVVGAGVVLLVAGALVGARLGTEFLPELDEGDIYVFAELPPSVSLEEGQRRFLEVRRILMDFPEVATVISEQGRPEDGTDNEGVNMAKIYVRLIDRDDWRTGLSKADLVDEMRAAVRVMPGIQFTFTQPIRDAVEEYMAGVRGQVVLKVFGEDMGAMRGALVDAIDVLAEIPGVVDIGLYRDSLAPQLQIRLDRAALAREGVLVKQANEVIETSLAGTVATEYWEGERPIPIRVRLPMEEREDPGAIGDLQIPNAAGGYVPLRDVAAITVEHGMTFIMREENVRFQALGFNVHGRDMGSVVNDAIAAVDDHVTLPEGHRFEWAGEFENQQRALQRLSVVVPVSILIVLMLLFAALNSLIGAVTILLTAPFALTGGAFALWLAGVPLSVSAAVGFIALLGQVSLMGLLVLTGVENKRREGLELFEAITEGATVRIRAVLMASLLAAAGLVPMAFGSGLGSETQQPFALVIVGGMITVFLVAVFLLPVLYSYFARKTVRQENGDVATA